MRNTSAIVTIDSFTLDQATGGGYVVGEGYYCDPPRAKPSTPPRPRATPRPNFMAQCGAPPAGGGHNSSWGIDIGPIHFGHDDRSETNYQTCVNRLSGH